MADSIEVHFTSSNNRKLRAIVQPSSVKGRLVLSDGGPTETEFADKHNLTIKRSPPKLPAGIRVIEGTKSLESLNGLKGPGVCYWIGEELVCW